MFKPKFQMLLTKQDFSPDEFSCLGAQLITIIQLLTSTLGFSPSHSGASRVNLALFPLPMVFNHWLWGKISRFSTRNPSDCEEDNPKLRLLNPLLKPQFWLRANASGYGKVFRDYAIDLVVKKQDCITMALMNGSEKMKTLIRHDLEFERSYSFVQWILKSEFVLPSELLKAVDFSKGNFFTLLPEGSNLERIYEFWEGIVVPQSPICEHLVNGQKSYYSYIPTIKRELAAFIFNRLRIDPSLSVVINDVMTSPDDSGLEFYRLNSLLHTYNNEVLYNISAKNLALNFIEECLNNSRSAFWIAFCFLTKSDLSKKEEAVDLDCIRDACRQTTVAIFGAYDGEGYLFWERFQS